MPDDLDELRRDIANVFGKATFMGGTYDDAAQGMIEFLRWASDAQRLTILRQLGYEVREEWLYEQYSPDYGKYLVLCEQRETTDA